MDDSKFFKGRGTVEPFDLPPPFPGGLPSEGATNQVDADSVYGQLPRPSVISPPWRFLPETKNKAAKQTYLSMYAGHFYGQWGKPRGSDDSRFIMDVGSLKNAPDPFASAPLLSITVWCTTGMVNRNHTLAYYMDNEEFKAAFSVKEKMRLVHRLMHLYLRSYGAQLPTITVENVYGVLSEEYIQNKWYEGLLDLGIIYVDSAINCNREWCHISHIGKKMQRIGETLESLGRFQDAARLYIEIAENLYVDNCYEERATLYDCAGVAFRRAKHYTNAECAYVTALHIQSTSSEDWDINANVTTMIFTNLLMLYYAWGRESSSLTRFATDTEKMKPALIPILFCAGFKAEKGGKSESMVIHNGPGHKKLLKRPVQKKSGAMAALSRATAAACVEHFRRELLSCLLVQAMVQDLPIENDHIDDVMGAREVLGEGILNTRAPKATFDIVHAKPSTHIAVCRWQLEKKRKAKKKEAKKKEAKKI